MKSERQREKGVTGKTTKKRGVRGKTKRQRVVCGFKLGKRKGQRAGVNIRVVNVGKGMGD